MPKDKLAKLQSLQAIYGEQLPKQIAALNACFSYLCLGFDRDALQELHRLSHNMAGAAGTFGYSKLSSQAHLLEQVVVAVLHHGQLISEVQLAEMASILAIMEQAATERTTLVEVKLSTKEQKNEDNQTIMIIEDDVLLAQEMVGQLAIYGWQAQVFHNAYDAKLALEKQKLTPAAVLVDIMLPEGELAGTELIQQLRHNHNYLIPTIVISASWDWASRLSAARAGANAYLVKPVDMASVIETLDKLTQTTTQKPFQVLMVEDNTLLCRHYTDVLTQAGMQVIALENPAQLLSTLDHFSPDLVLLDLYLQDCTGIEVARVIRQDKKFTDLPIVFLSTESGMKMQQLAMQTGADDFLNKPIADVALVHAVSVRVLRFRALRELTRQDRMTGLLNHIAFHLQLEFELGRLQRSDAPLAVAILDIDKFKNINDSYGHPVGDIVIKNLAHLLKKRLRRSDIIGRLGGEEFGVIMTNTPDHIAVKVLNELRTEFAKLQHTGSQVVFNCTFSAGVAGLTEGCSADSLLKAADAALYFSKEHGRNQVTLSASTNSSTTDIH